MKEEKKKIIEMLREKIRKAKIILFLNFHKVTSPLLFELREKAKEKNCELKVAKKTLSKMALEKENVKIDLEKFKNEFCFLFSFSDEVLPAKLAFEFSRESPLEILGGWLDGKFLSKEEVEEFSRLKSKNELISGLSFSLKYLLWRLTFVLDYNLKGLARVLNQIKNGRER